MYYLGIAIYINGKGSIFFYKCAVRFVNCTLPSRRRGGLQRTVTEINKTGPISKESVLVEQLRRHLNTFRIITNEMAISFYHMLMIF